MRQVYNVAPYIITGRYGARWVRAKVNGVWCSVRLDFGPDVDRRYARMCEQVAAARVARQRMLRAERIRFCLNCGAPHR